MDLQEGKRAGIAGAKYAFLGRDGNEKEKGTRKPSSRGLTSTQPSVPLRLTVESIAILMMRTSKERSVGATRTVGLADAHMSLFDASSYVLLFACVAVVFAVFC